MRLKISEKGQALVEFAIILPIILLLLGPVVDLGRAIYTKYKLQVIASDMLNLSIIQNEYAFQSTFYAIEDLFLTEDIEDYRGNKDSDEYEGYLISKMFDKFLKTDNLDNYIDSKDFNKYIKISPTIQRFNHKGHYAKLEKNKGNMSIKPEYILFPNSYNSYGYDNLGYDKYGLDRLGYFEKPVRGYMDQELYYDANGKYAGTNDSEKDKSKRWQLKGMDTFDNFTYYREIEINLPYKMENITFLGKIILGDYIDLEESRIGYIFMGGDGILEADY